jgi:lipopolysaccharide biosynthesis glycosyltransferase
LHAARAILAPIRPSTPPPASPVPAPQFALVLAVNEAFVPGASACLKSFLRHNSWFDARVVIVADGLGAASCETLARCYPVEFVMADPALGSILASHVRARALRSTESARLLALQVFSLQGFDRVVFLDADTLCLGDLRPLFDETADFAAAPDPTHVRRSMGGGAHGSDPADARSFAPYGRALSYSFNTGVMTIGGTLLRSGSYHALLELAARSDLPGVRSLGDQLVLNHFFDGTATPLDPRYNFQVSAESLLRRGFGLTLADVRVLHFAGCPKPWLESWETARKRVPARFLRYYDCWYEFVDRGFAPTDRDTLEQERAGLDELSRLSRGWGA